MRLAVWLILTMCVCIGTASAATVQGEAPWNDYRVIMWQPQTSAAYRTLARLGVDAAMVYRGRPIPQALSPLRAAGLGWYFENLATDFYAPYHRWTKGKPVNWRFLAVKRRYRSHSHDPSVFYRQPCLNNPVWLAQIRSRLTRAVRESAPYPPLFYNLADESGIADNGSYWDFDLSPCSLAGMRAWLKGQYASLDALNREWATHFARWDAVMPETTSQAFARRDQNFAAWADFKTWMDVAFARAFRTATEAAHAADPHARTALEGGQIPGWGGYNYARLAGAVDVMEIYDYAQNIDIVRSLAPRTVLLSTMGGSGPGAAHRVWNLLLRGEHGVILWDPGHRFVWPNGVPGPRAADAAALFAKLRGGIGALLIGAARHIDPVASLYSPPSFRTQWILDVKPMGPTWVYRTADSEYEDDAVRAARRAFQRAFQRLGIEARYISPAELAAGVLERRGAKVLVLPHIIALSDTAVDAVRRFAAAGGIVIADVVPGAFDAHSKRRAKSPLAGLFAARKANIKLMTIGDVAALAATLSPVLSAAGITPAERVTGANGERPGDVQSYAFRDGAVTVMAVQRVRPKGPQPPDETVTLALPAETHITDLMAGKALGAAGRVTIALGTIAPALYAVSPRPLAPLEISVPAKAAPGTTVTIRVRRGTTIARLRPIHVAVINPNGTIAPRMSGNLFLTHKAAAWPLTLGPDAPPGTWHVRLSDILAGTARRFDIAVREREPRGRRDRRKAGVATGIGPSRQLP